MPFLLWACHCAPEPDPHDSADTGEIADSGPEVETSTESGPDTAPPDSAPDSDGDTAGWSCEEPRTYEGDLVLRTNEAVETFCDDHNTVSGDLTFHLGDEDDPILQLDGARCLCDVGGDLELYYAPALPADTGEPGPPPGFGAPPPHVSTDFELVNVRTIGGDLYVHHIPGVTSVQTFTELHSVGGDVRVEDNEALTTVILPALTELGGSLAFLDLTELLALSVPELATVPGDVLVGDPEERTWHHDLATIDLGSLQEVGGELSLRGLPAMESVALLALAEVEGVLTFEASCASELQLASLTAVGGLALQGLCGIEDLGGLGSLTEVGGDLAISGNSALSQDEVDAFVEAIAIAGEVTAVGSEGGDCDDHWRAVWYRASSCDRSHGGPRPE